MAKSRMLRIKELYGKLDAETDARRQERTRLEARIQALQASLPELLSERKALSDKLQPAGVPSKV